MFSSDELTERLPDRFGAARALALTHLQQHGCTAAVPPWAQAQALAVLVRLSHATYLLVLDGGLGYAALHMAAALGLAGRMDLVEADEQHVAFVERMFAEYGLQEKLKLVGRSVADTIPYLNGPYDLIVAHRPAGLDGALLASIYRLLRVGGAAVLDLTGSEGLPNAVGRLFSDERWLTAVLGSFAAAVKLR